MEHPSFLSVLSGVVWMVLIALSARAILRLVLGIRSLQRRMDRYEAFARDVAERQGVPVPVEFARPRVVSRGTGGLKGMFASVRARMARK